MKPWRTALKLQKARLSNMDATTKAKVLSFMPSSLSTDARVDVWLEEAELQVDAEYFGASYALALSYFASHSGTLETRGGADEVGSLTSKSEGSISVSYSPAGSGTDDDLLQTIYGRKFLNLRQNCRGIPFITG